MYSPFIPLPESHPLLSHSSFSRRMNTLEYLEAAGILGKEMSDSLVDLNTDNRNELLVVGRTWSIERKRQRRAILAFLHLERASKHGLVEAMVNLGNMFYNQLFKEPESRLGINMGNEKFDMSGQGTLDIQAYMALQYYKTALHVSKGNQEIDKMIRPQLKELLSVATAGAKKD